MIRRWRRWTALPRSGPSHAAPAIGRQKAHRAVPRSTTSQPQSRYYVFMQNPPGAQTVQRTSSCPDTGPVPPAGEPSRRGQVAAIEDAAGGAGNGTRRGAAAALHVAGRVKSAPGGLDPCRETLGVPAGGLSIKIDLIADRCCLAKADRHALPAWWLRAAAAGSVRDSFPAACRSPLPNYRASSADGSDGDAPTGTPPPGTAPEGKRSS